MRIPYGPFSLVLATGVVACGGDLTLPDDGSPAALRVESGDGQQGTVGRKLNAPLVVKLTDASSRPVEGVSVVFQFKTDVPDAAVDSSATTDSTGRAEAEVRLGSSVGPHQVEARVATSTALSAIFVVTAVERGRGGRSGDEGNGD